MTGRPVAVLGGGVIGASWVSLFAAAGFPVTCFDPSDNAETFVRDYAMRTMPTLERLGLAHATDPAPLRFANSAEKAVAGAHFV